METTYYNEFMEQCAAAACDDATQAILGSITGNSGLFGCDMLNILYFGDVNDGYYQGWRDQFTSKAGYLLSLVNMGVTAQSAFITLQTG